MMGAKRKIKEIPRSRFEIVVFVLAGVALLNSIVTRILYIVNFTLYILR